MVALSRSQELGDQVRAELANLIDLQMSPLGVAAMNALAPAPGQTVLDVGCGAGETVLQVMDRVGPTGRVIGVDIGPRALAVARARTAHLPQVTLLHEDAAILKVADRTIDSIFSRFGTMFFSNPIAAFTNMHRMLKRGGRIGFVCWRSMRENELDFVPVEAAGLTTAIDRTPFSFEDPSVIDHVLCASGFARIAIEAHDADVSCGGVEATLKVVTRVGALGAVLRETPELLSKAERQVRAALLRRQQDKRVNLRAAAWIVTARASW